MPRVPYAELYAQFLRVLESRGFDKISADEAATVFAQNSLDGIYSHGINRFARFASYLDQGSIDPKAVATLENSFGCFERWDGHRGCGPLNAKRAMDRACELAKEFGVGLVALGNNNHWMRGGSYGWQAANKGCVAICWSNTMPNMPAWGGKDRKIGNNPLVIAIPRSSGLHVVVDCAMSQFSYGKIEEARLKGQQLAVAGGYNVKGELTADPAEIEETWRVLPAGFWKGSGISIALDLVATVLSSGNSVAKIGTFSAEEGLSQVLIAIDPSKMDSVCITDQMVDDIIADLKTSEPIVENGEVYYPGERVVRIREENTALGIPVLDEKWNELIAL